MNYVFLSFKGHDIFHSGHMTGSVKASLSGMSAQEQATHRLGCFHLLVHIPVACALLQLAFWHYFSLKGDRLKRVKELRRGFEHDKV